MSFAEKVHNRLLALESQVQALDKRLKRLEFTMAPEPEEAPWKDDPIKVVVAPIKRKPGRPKKVANA